MLISFLHLLIFMLCNIMFCGTTAFVVVYIVPLYMTKLFRIYFHLYVRVRCLPFGCVV